MLRLNASMDSLKEQARELHAAGAPPHVQLKLKAQYEQLLATFCDLQGQVDQLDAREEGPVNARLMALQSRSRRFRAARTARAARHVRLPRRGHVGARQARPRRRALSRSSSRSGDSGDPDEPEPHRRHLSLSHSRGAT
jgi:hypothetical protein